MRGQSLEANIRSFWAAGIFPLGYLLWAMTRASEDAQTQKSLIDIQKTLKSGGITILSAHQRRNVEDMMAQAYLLAKLGAENVALPVAGLQYNNPFLYRALFRGVERIPGMHVFPVYRREERKESGQASSASQSSMDDANIRYQEALPVFAKKPKSGILVAPHGTRKAIVDGQVAPTAELRRGVASHLAEGFPAVLSTAVVDLLRGKIDIRFSPVQAFRNMSAEEIDESLKSQFAPMLR